MDILKTILSNPVAIFAYLMMALVFFETLCVAGRANSWMAEARLHIINRGGLAHDPLYAPSPAEIVSELGRSARSLELFAQIAPVLGLGWTMASFGMALFGLDTALSEDPDGVFMRMGIGPGTSVVGLLCLLVALAQHARIREVLISISEITTAMPPAKTGPQAMQMEQTRAQVSPYANQAPKRGLNTGGRFRNDPPVQRPSPHKGEPA